MRTIKMKCTECGKAFEKPVKEYNRCVREGRKAHFCSVSCGAFYANRQRPPDFWKSYDLYPIKHHSANRLGTFSPFKCYLHKGRASVKRHGMSLTLEYLKKLWDSQNGRCPYTGIKMELPKHSGDKFHSLKKASLDRIDSSKGYIEGNVEFVCWAINGAKNSHSKEEMKSFLREIDLSVTRS